MNYLPPESWDSGGGAATQFQQSKRLRPRLDYSATLSYSVIAFATVFPACLLHERVLGVLGVWDTVRWRRANAHSLETVALVLGTGCIVLPLVFPRTCFWLVWGALLGVPEFIRHRCGDDSLIDELAAGRPARFLRLLAGGMIAGGIWEGMNYWARCKWIYTVPGMETWKIFEMPVLGFLGFPVLALNAHSIYQLVTLIWSRSGPRGRLGLAALGLAVTLLGHSYMMANSVLSHRPVLHQLPSAAQTLAGEYGFASVEEAAARCEGSADPELEGLCETIAMSLHKGMGIPKAVVLVQHGIRDPADLVSTKRILGAFEQSDLQVGPAEAAVWVRAAPGGYRR